MQSFDHAIGQRAITTLKPWPRNARTHSRKQIRQIADSIRRFGFTNPVLIGADGSILAGHGRVEAAKLLGLESVPTLELAHLNEAERRAYVLADNKLALSAGWNQDMLALALELQALVDLDFEFELTGFSLAEIDLVLDAHRDGAPQSENTSDDEVPQHQTVAVSRTGDLWQLGRHRLLCGDARSRDDMRRLMGDDVADLIFTDPPYNVPIAGHVSGLGKIRHREFEMASGEMTRSAFSDFLQQTLGQMATACRDGAIAFVCMDWRHMGELLTAGAAVFDEFKNWTCNGFVPVTYLTMPPWLRRRAG